MVREVGQRSLWERKWKQRGREPPNSFAKRAWQVMRKHGTKTLLEIGCGSGRDTLFFARKGLRITAVDFSRNALSALERGQKSVPNITTRCVDIRKLRSGVKYDSIYAHLSLHYFTNEETERVFARLRAMLKPGGLLFVKCKSTDDMLYGRGKRVEEDMYLYKGHVRRFFSKGYMREKLRNFSSVRIRKTSSTYHTYKSSFVEAIAAR